MKKLNIVLSIIGFALIIIPFFICKYSIYRLVSTVLGLIIVSLVNIIYHKQLVLRIIFIPIIIFTITYITDYFVMNIFNSYPIMAIKYTSSEKVSTYNSFIWFSSASSCICEDMPMYLWVMATELCCRSCCTSAML